MKLNIEPIKLLKGSHRDTGATGQGCFMNVIAYLNGEPQITDKSPCVCPVVKPIAIWLNDYLVDGERDRLIPYIERAMGSVTEDKAELIRRAWLAANFAKECAKGAEATWAPAWAEEAAWAAAKAAKAAKAAWAGEAAAKAAKAAWAAWAAPRRALIEAAFTFFDKALPQPTEPAEPVKSRAKVLVTLAAIGIASALSGCASLNQANQQLIQRGNPIGMWNAKCEGWVVQSGLPLPIGQRMVELDAICPGKGGAK